MMNKTVPKTSVKASLNLFRRLAVALVLLFAAQGVWGAENSYIAYVWTDESSTDNTWTTPGNWKTVTVTVTTDDEGNITNTTQADLANPAPNYPGSDAKVIIPDGTTLTETVTNLTNYNVDDITINGTFNIIGDLTLAKINTASSGTLIVNGQLTNNSQYIAENLSIICNSLSMTGGLKVSEILVSGSTEIISTLWLVATNTTEDSAGITFGGNVTVDASGDQFVLAGKVNAKESKTVTIAVTHGLLNHFQEGGIEGQRGGLHQTVHLCIG